MIRFLAAALLTLVGGCAAESGEGEEEATAESEDAILGGQVETGHPAVGMLRFVSGAFGTGTLIAPDVVLTAAHVAAGKPKQFFYGAPLRGKGPTPDNLRVEAVAEIVMHPCYTAPKGDDCPAGGDPIDVALVRLAHPITDVTPVPIVGLPLRYFWGAYSPYDGDSCVAVGFGAHLLQDGKTTLGTRRSSRSTVDEVKDTEIVATWGTGLATSGDSGGPLICNGRIIGTVRGSAAPVPKSTPFVRTREGYERIDLWGGWIGRTRAAWR